MKKVLTAFFFFTLYSVTASAAPVTYSTNGVFSGCTDVAGQVSGCTANGNTITFGASGDFIQLTFAGISNSTVNATTAASFGDIIFSCLAGGTGCSAHNIPANLLLTINVSQTAPTVGGPTGIPAAGISGSVSGTSNSGVVSWPANNTINIGPISYRIANTPLNLVPPSSNSGHTTVQGVITDNTVPEPSTMSMIGLAALGLGLIGRRKSA
ncbi:MAG: PEP-CTERM sorting domain-containing protein [Acidobacteria bacterium]|nr:PEP-CTERM sorting domain-containing protein [Acidobacteriota bacterium]